MNIRPENHRGDFETCPCCDKKFEYETWREKAISFSTQIWFGKHAYGVIVSECPSCGDESWVHEELRGFEWSDFPKRWKTRAAKELKRRQLGALRAWGRGICWKCKNLESGEVSTHAWRRCGIGIGPAETECDSFVPAAAEEPTR